MRSGYNAYSVSVRQLDLSAQLAELGTKKLRYPLAASRCRMNSVIEIAEVFKIYLAREIDAYTALFPTSLQDRVRRKTVSVRAMLKHSLQQ